MMTAKKRVLKSPAYLRAELPLTMVHSGGGRFDVVDRRGWLIGVTLHEDDARLIVQTFNDRETEKMP